MKEHFNSA